MFDGVPDQFHQFIAPRTSSLPLHFSFPLHASATPNSIAFPSPFDPYNNNPSPHHLPLQQQPNLLHPHCHHSPIHKHQDKDHSMNLHEINDRETSQLPDLIDSCSWTHDEVLALFRIRSTMDTTWFPDLTWEHVSRKLAEVGFKRSAEKCKEKFEEESRHLSNINYSENYRFLSELEQELYQGEEGDHQNPEPEVGSEKPREGQDKTSSGHTREEAYSRHDTSVEKSKDRKRKRQDNQFELFKGFCENIVNKMMAQQEEMHNKLLEDMLKRDQEKFAREEAWKKQEIDRMNKELEMMAQEQAVAGDRQATVIEFLKKFSTANRNVKNTRTCSPSPPTLHSQNPNLSCRQMNDDDNNNVIDPPPPTCPGTVVAAENPSSQSQDTMEVAQNPSSMNYSVSTCTASATTVTWSSGKGDSVGRRWPRDEVIALINLRCSINSSVNGNEEKEGNKAPLWERISQGMAELGYKRRAKRCKEKWENINKYFRKTKDINKKRSIHSRTCPYFHQLTTLYSQGKLASQSERPQNQPPDPQSQPHSSQHMHVLGAQKTFMQPPEALETDQHL